MKKEEMMKNEIQSVQFKDGYIVIETLGRTHSIKRSDIGDGEWDSLQGSLLQIVDRGYKKQKYYDWNSDGIDRTIR
jgi:hypothetical protein